MIVAPLLPFLERASQALLRPGGGCYVHQSAEGVAPALKLGNQPFGRYLAVGIGARQPSRTASEQLSGGRCPGNADAACFQAHRIDPLLPPHAEAAGGGHIMAPIPGRIADVLVQPGEAVTRGQPMLVLEAMKMEIPISADETGEIVEVRCARGKAVSAGETLLVLRPL